MAAKKKATPPPHAGSLTLPANKVSTLDGFLRQFIDQHKKREDQPFCFILGAGASRDSGIKTGGEMAEEWLKQLHENRNHKGLQLDEWIAKGHLGIADFDPKIAARHYSQLYELLFKDKEQAGFSYLETVMEGKEPSFGYSVLSYLLSETHHRIVITTNFDNLVTDALAIHSGTFPIVVNDDSLVHYVRANVHRPLVAKIHGSLGFTPKSRNGDLTLDDKWRKALEAIFQTHTPVVIGYDGNDGSLMKLLEETAKDAPPEFIWWCYHCKSGEDPHARANEQPERVKRLIASRPAEFVPIPGFDLFMLKMLNQLNKESKDVPDLVQRLEERTQGRLEAYKKQQDKLGAELATASKTKPAPADSLTKTADQDLNDEVALLAKGAKSKPWWRWQIEIDSSEDSDRKDELYRSAINALPSSPELLGNYALFLNYDRRDYDAAEIFYKRVLEADPNRAVALGNYALFLTEIRQDHDEAEIYYKRSLEADPKNAINLGNYASFLTDIREDQEAAEVNYRRALEIDPKSASILGNYAAFLYEIRKNYTSAEVFYKRALEADPDEAAALGNYALFLTGIRQDHDAAEVYYKRALEADPKNANNLGNYATFLMDTRQDHEAAEDNYKRALEVDPKHANNLGNYAVFLTHIRQDHEAAEALYKRSLDASSKMDNKIGNYGQFLIGQSRELEGLVRLRIAWSNLDMSDMADCAEFAYSLWLGTCLLQAEERVWEQAFKYLIQFGFKRPIWNFDAMLAVAEKKLKSDDYDYAKALAEAFLDQAKVPSLEKFPRWTALEPLDPSLLKSDGTIIEKAAE